MDPSMGTPTDRRGRSPLGTIGYAADRLDREKTPVQQEDDAQPDKVTIQLTTPNDTTSSLHGDAPSPVTPSSPDVNSASSEAQFLPLAVAPSSTADPSPSAPVTASSTEETAAPIQLADPLVALRKKREEKRTRSLSPEPPARAPSPGSFFGQEEHERGQEEDGLATPRASLFPGALVDSDEDDSEEAAQGRWKETVVLPVDSDSSKDGTSSSEGDGSPPPVPHVHHPEHHYVDPDEGIEICNSPEDTDDTDLPSPVSPTDTASHRPPRARPLHPALAGSAIDGPFGGGPLTMDAPSFFPPQGQGPSPPPEMALGGGEGEDPALLDQEGFLPAVDLEDESLTTLERIFLLSKSEFTHHRTFISKVIGDWVEDVDPCETVEYVLPLLNSLGTDEGQ